MNQKTEFALIAAGTVVALYFVNNIGAEAGSGISTGAAVGGSALGIGGGIGLVILAIAFAPAGA